MSKKSYTAARKTDNLRFKMSHFINTSPVFASCEADYVIPTVAC